MGVAGALPIMFAGEEMSVDAVTALITLARDSDPDVRDWATSSLGNQGRADSDAIRDALAARLKWAGDEDAHSIAMGYAIARCKPGTHH